MAIQDLNQQFPIVDPKTGKPTDYFMRMLKGVTGPVGEVGQDIQTLFDRNLIAGAGLTGGGKLSADRTFAVGAGTGITVNADDVAIDTAAEAERIRDVIGAALVAGSNVTITVNDAGDTITIASTGGGGGSFRGALVKKSANQNGANYTTAAFVSWDAESYDSDGIHDNVTNNSRLTVPSGVTKVRLSAQIGCNNVSGGIMVLEIQKAGSVTFDGYAQMRTGAASTAPHAQVFTPVLNVTDGDYFEVKFTLTTDTSIDILAAESWFAMEIIG